MTRTSVSATATSLLIIGVAEHSGWTTQSNLGQLWCTDDGIALFQQFAAFTLVVKGTIMGLCISMGGTEVVSTSEQRQQQKM